MTISDDDVNDIRKAADEFRDLNLLRIRAGHSYVAHFIDPRLAVNNDLLGEALELIQMFHAKYCCDECASTFGTVQCVLCKRVSDLLSKVKPCPQP